MSINGREVYNSNSLQAYKSYLAHEFSFSPTAKCSNLTGAGYYYDQGTSLESGEGFNKRKNRFLGKTAPNVGKGVTAQFMAKLDLDLANQPVLLANFCELDIEILPAENRFLLSATQPVVNNVTQPMPNYKLEIVSCKLYIKKVEVLDSLALEIARKLEITPARYALRKTMLKPLFISQGRYEFNANLFMDQVPRRITMGLVSNSDYVGNYSSSPFNFKHFDVREISVIANGRAYPNAPYDLDYAAGKYVRPYNDMNEAINLANTMDGNGISYEQYAATHCVYIFNLTNSGEDHAGMFDLIKNGTTAVNIKFAKPVPDGGLVLICMGEADSLLMLDKFRTISADTTI